MRYRILFLSFFQTDAAQRSRGILHSHTLELPSWRTVWQGMEDLHRKGEGGSAAQSEILKFSFTNFLNFRPSCGRRLTVARLFDYFK